ALPEVGGNTSAAEGRRERAKRGSREAAREDEPVPGSVRAADRRHESAGRARRDQRSLSTGAGVVLDRKGRLRTGHRGGCDPMRTLQICGLIAAGCLATRCTSAQGTET